eukprot:1341467-Rhodomonas_salina.2
MACSQAASVDNERRRVADRPPATGKLLRARRPTNLVTLVRSLSVRVRRLKLSVGIATGCGSAQATRILGTRVGARRHLLPQRPGGTRVPGTGVPTTTSTTVTHCHAHCMALGAALESHRAGCHWPAR